MACFRLSASAGCKPLYAHPACHAACQCLSLFNDVASPLSGRFSSLNIPIYHLSRANVHTRALASYPSGTCRGNESMDVSKLLCRNRDPAAFAAKPPKAKSRRMRRRRCWLNRYLPCRDQCCYIGTKAWEEVGCGVNLDGDAHHFHNSYSMGKGFPPNAHT